MTPAYSPVRAVRRVLLGAVAASLTLTAVVTGSANAEEAVCGTDYECAAVELSAAFHAGTPVFEDLSFAGASELYRLKRPVLLAAFEQYTGHADSAAAGPQLEDWLDEQIGAE